MITDLFSHKIHSSGDDWPEKLAELAAIFGEFDGQLFNRNEFEQRLRKISPRVSYLTGGNAALPLSKSGRLDVSKFRDEISAYPSYLGLYFIEQSTEGWKVRVSQTAKRFLLCEEPDVGAFLRLQLPLFQYPNAMGAVYTSSTNSLHMQSNSQKRTLEFIQAGVHLSPVRLIAIALQADAKLQGIDILIAKVRFDEIFALANTSKINKFALPPLDAVIEVLKDIRLGLVAAPEKYETRFHTLRHMEMFAIEKQTIRLRDSINEIDKEQLRKQLDAICRITNQFDRFDSCITSTDLEQVIASGEWGQFFDGLRVLPSNLVDALTNDVLISSEIARNVLAELPNSHQVAAETYPFRERTEGLVSILPYSRRKELADPEITKVKRQKRNLAHKELVDKMDSWLRGIGAQPKENEHIDLFAKIPSDGSFIFEMKSGGDSLHEQIRKGLSQLYEYRYRYKTVIADEQISLCLVLPENPTSIPWVTDYLCKDREIALCWFEEGDKLIWPSQCNDSMSALK